MVIGGAAGYGFIYSLLRRIMRTRNSNSIHALDIKAKALSQGFRVCGSVLARYLRRTTRRKLHSALKCQFDEFSPDVTLKILQSYQNRMLLLQ